MATTRIMPLHIGKGRTESRAISAIIDYVANPQKTDHGRLITGYECDSRVADAEFMLAKRQYIVTTGRVRGADDVIAYQLTGKREFTAASMPYPALFTAPGVARFTGGSHGITGESTPPYGGAVPAWSMDQLSVTHRPFRSRICRQRWYRQSTLRLATGKKKHDGHSPGECGGGDPAGG